METTQTPVSAGAISAAIKAQADAKVNAQQAPGYEAQGFALAQTVIAECKGQGNTWARYAAILSGYEVKAREAFMKELRKHLKEMGEHVKAMEGKTEHEVYRRAASSARTMISNLVAVAKGMNAGYVLQIRCDDSTGVPLTDSRGNRIPVQPFATILAEAKMFNESQATGAGRPKKSIVDKMKKFILDNQPDFAERVDDVVALVQEMASTTKKAAAIAAAAKK